MRSAEANDVPNEDRFGPLRGWDARRFSTVIFVWRLTPISVWFPWRLRKKVYGNGMRVTNPEERES
jgi:hypothetical protein